MNSVEGFVKLYLVTSLAGVWQRAEECIQELLWLSGICVNPGTGLSLGNVYFVLSCTFYGCFNVYISIFVCLYCIDN